MPVLRFIQYNLNYRDFNLILYPDDQFIDPRASIHDNNGQEWSKTHVKSFLYAGHDVSKLVYTCVTYNKK